MSSSPKRFKQALPYQAVPFLHNCMHFWEWNKHDKDDGVFVMGEKKQKLLFHPTKGSCTSGIRGTNILNGGQYYWEISFSEIHGTNKMMVGIGTKKACLGSPHVTDLLGADEHSWGLSHEGLVWHSGFFRRLTQPLDLKSSTIGLLFDGIKGTLAYYKNREFIGVAFTKLDEVEDEIYPMVSSAAIITVHLEIATYKFITLKERCRKVINQNIREEQDIEKMKLPTSLKKYLKEEVNHLR